LAAVGEVRINDRGPYAGNRVIDLSKAAAAEIDMISTGTAHVRGEILE
jgi:rare lipoprotein A